MRVEDDKVEGTKWIVAKSSAKYLNSGNDVQLYINARGISSILRFKIQYAGNDWIFIEEYFFNVDGETFSIPVEYGDVERDNGYGGVWELYDEAPVPSSRLSMIDKIISSQSTVLRFKGKRDKDIEITKAQKRALSDVLTVYDGLQRGKYSSQVTASVDAPIVTTTTSALTLISAQERAKIYMTLAPWSRPWLIKQLKSIGYSTAEATYGVDALNVNWNEQAKKVARNYVNRWAVPRSRIEVISWLENRGFPKAQAEYGVTAIGL